MRGGGLIRGLYWRSLQAREATTAIVIAAVTTEYGDTPGVVQGCFESLRRLGIGRGQLRPGSRGIVTDAVVPGSLPGRQNPDGSPSPSLYCAVIVKTVDAQTRSKTSINELLRT